VSYDLQVIVKREPGAADLAAFLESARGSLESDGTLKRGDLLLLRDKRGTFVEIDGPNRVVAADLPDAAYGAVARTGWLVGVSVKPSADASWPHDLAVHLARVAQGVVYDPQQDAVTWPAGWRALDRRSGSQLINQVGLAWYMRRPEDASDLPRRVLDVLASRCPEAMPVRYGAYEPYQHRRDSEHGTAEFVAFWAAIADDWSSSFSWTAKRPCFDGSVNISSLRAYPRGSPCASVHLSMTFDGRPFVRDPAFSERMVGAFTELAASLGSFYAAAWVERGIELRGGRPRGTALSEIGPMPGGDAWVGLPASPTWLAWFGHPYTELVRQAVAAAVTSETDAGLFLRLETQPSDADELADTFPPLPAWLLARRRDQAGLWLPGARFSFLDGPPSQPAEYIPDLLEGR
jgi:hypothetical protein